MSEMPSTTFPHSFTWATLPTERHVNETSPWTYLLESAIRLLTFAMFIRYCKMLFIKLHTHSTLILSQETASRDFMLYVYVSAMAYQCINLFISKQAWIT